MNFYTTSTLLKDLKSFESYVIYDKEDKKYWFKGKLVCITGDKEANPCLTFFLLDKSKKWSRYVHNFYNQIIIKSFKEHHDFLKNGYQSLISKLYEEKTEQNGNPDCGPSSVICSMLI